MGMRKKEIELRVTGFRLGSRNDERREELGNDTLFHVIPGQVEIRKG